MDSATHDLLLQRVHEIVFDEERIVTCMSLAADLKVSLKDAKVALQTFVKDNKGSNTDLMATYMVSGSLKDGKGLAVHLIQESELNKQKTLFNHISSELVYSIQKGKSVDFGAISLAHPPPGTWQGIVVSKTCIKRNIVKKTFTPAIATSTILPIKQPLINDDKQNDEHPTSSKKDHMQTQQKELVKPKQNGGITNFFSKMSATTKKNVNQNGLHKETNDKPSPELKEPQNGLKRETEIQDVEMKEVMEEKKIEKSQEKSGCKKRKKENKNNQPHKKRKRIQVICDSDSDDIFDDEENEDIIEKSDEEPVHVPEVKTIETPKNKIRKAVDKTYMDDEGFFVTTTEYVYESASEDEEKLSVKVNTDPKKVLTEKKPEEVSGMNKTKSATNKGKNNKKVVSGKQSTIMNFFKKT